MTGRKYSLPALVSNILIFLVVLGTLVSINMEISDLQNAPPPADGVDMSGLSIGILTILVVLILIYGGVVMVNLILKIAHVASDAWGFAIPCLIIDLVVLVANGALAVNAVNESGVAGIAVGGGLVILSLVSICSNILSIAKRDE
jgi:hypothetical protein